MHFEIVSSWDIDKILTLIYYAGLRIDVLRGCPQIKLCAKKKSAERPFEQFCSKIDIVNGFISVLSGGGTLQLQAKHSGIPHSLISKPFLVESNPIPLCKPIVESGPLGRGLKI